MGLRQGRPVLPGILVIALGIVWLLNNLEITRVDIGRAIATYWPVLLIVWGIDFLGLEFWPAREGSPGKRRSSGRLLTGVVLFGLGVLILGRNTGIYEFDLSVFWRIFGRQ